MLQQFEVITNKNNNSLTNLYIFRMLDIIMRNKWYSIQIKDVWNLIYLANYLFDLHDIFKGTYISLRAVNYSREILLGILDCKKGQLAKDQSMEINKILSYEIMKSYEVVSMEFEIKTKKIRQKLDSFDMKEKVEGIKEMVEIFQKCRTYQEQL